MQNLGYATRAGIQVEERMLSIERSGRKQAEPILDRVEAVRFVASAAYRSKEEGRRWTVCQERATIDLLASTSMVTAVQGLAGTAKTTTVLRESVRAMKARGCKVRAFAPTAAAARVLREAIGTDADTVARLITTGDKVRRAAARERETWIIDEASLVSAKDMSRLLGFAKMSGARIILAGDVNQLGSVEAGSAFAQLQDGGMETATLTEIVRQANPLALRAVEASLTGDAAAAFDALDKGGGRVVEIEDADARYAAMAREFVSLPAREREATLLVDTTKEGRAKLTTAVRNELFRDGTLSGPPIGAVALENVGLTETEAAHSKHYTVGDVVIFTRDYEKRGVKKGDGFAVVEVDAPANRITLRTREGASIDWRIDQWGRSTAQAFRPRDVEFNVGDRIAFTRNDREAARANGDTALIERIDAGPRIMVVRDRSGRRQELHLDRTCDQHIRHGWVRTLHASQGVTADRVLVNMESFRARTVDTRASYVALSRARFHAIVFTENRAKLTDVLGIRTGERQTALDGPLAESRPVALSGWGLGE
jgi:ATP-dependent exoDNAse (exonuclease V) alpha subunit